MCVCVKQRRLLSGRGGGETSRSDRVSEAAQHAAEQKDPDAHITTEQRLREEKSPGFDEGFNARVCVYMCTCVC